MKLNKLPTNLINPIAMIFIVSAIGSGYHFLVGYLSGVVADQFMQATAIGVGVIAVSVTHGILGAAYINRNSEKVSS
jgi:hypothetical protein